MKCKHKSTHHRYWRDGAWCGVVYGVNAADWISTNDGSVVCQDCGAWLPLAPSNDADPRVAVEVRAAEIAAMPEPFRFWNLDEAHGWRDFVGDGGGECPCSVAAGSYVNNWHAGYLARCIVEHDTEAP